MSSQNVVFGDRAVVVFPAVSGGAPSGRIVIPGQWAALEADRPLTLSLWVNMARPGPLLTFLDAERRPALCLEVKVGGGIGVALTPAGEPETWLGSRRGSSFSVGEWRHLAAVLTVREARTTCAVYLDGECVAREADVAVGARPCSFVVVGARSHGGDRQGGFAGQLAEAQVWREAFDAQRVRTIAGLRASREELGAQPHCVGCWSFFDQSLVDASRGNFSRGELAGPAAFANSRLERTRRTRALRLNALTPAVSIPSHPAYDFAAADRFTIETWLRTDSGGRVVSRVGTAGHPVGFTMSVQPDGRVTFLTQSADGASATIETGPTAASDGQWHHVAVVGDAGRAIVCIDTEPVTVASSAYRPAFDAPGAPLVLGHATPTEADLYVDDAAFELGSNAEAARPYQLELAELRLWARAVPRDEMLLNLHTVVSDSAVGLVGAWSFASGAVADRSRHQNTPVHPGAGAIVGIDLDFGPARQALQVRADGGASIATAAGFGDGAFSIELWVAATSAGTLLERGEFDGDGSSIRLSTTVETLRLELKEASKPVEIFDAPLGVVATSASWRHVACTRRRCADGTLEVGFVIDGVIACLPAPSAARVTAGGELRLAPAGLRGRLGLVRVWTCARSVAELQETQGRRVAASAHHLAAQWSFMEGLALDSSKQQAHGRTAAGAVVVDDNTVPLDLAATVLALDGKGAFVDVGPAARVRFSGLAPFTVAAWVRPDTDHATGTILSRFDIDGAGEFALRLEQGRLIADRSDEGPPVRGSTRVVAGSWTHVAAIFDGEHLRLLVNGSADGRSVQQRATVAPTPTRLVLGAVAKGTGAAAFLPAQMREATIFATALEDDAVVALLSRPVVGNESHVAAHWNFLGATAIDLASRAAATLEGGARFARLEAPVLAPAPALRFGGNGDHIDCGAHYFGVDKNVTIESWVRVDDFDRPDQVLLSKGPEFRLTRHGSSNELCFATANLAPVDLVSSGAAIADGHWHHVAAVIDSASQHKRLYVDGKLVGSASFTGTLEFDARRDHYLVAAPHGPHLLSVDGLTGGRIQRHQLTRDASAEISEPVYGEGRLCFTVRSPSMRKLIVADPRAGELIWELPLDPHPGPPQLPLGVSGGHVALQLHEISAAFSLQRDRVQAFRLATPQWTAAPLVVDGIFLGLSGAPSTLHAYDLRRGALLWRRALSYEAGGVFGVCGGVIYSGGRLDAGRTRFGAYDLHRKGAVLWEVDGDPGYLASDPKGGSFAVVGDTVLAATLATSPATFVALAAREGRVTPVHQFSARPGPWIPADWVAGCPLMNGKFLFADVANDQFRELPQQPTELSHDTLFFRSPNAVRAASSDAPYRFRYALPLGRVGRVSVAGAPLCLGHDPSMPSSASFRGMLREVRLWSTARTADEIVRNLLHSVVGDEDGLSGAWACLQRVGRNETDLTRHGHPGAWQGSIATGWSDLRLLPPLPRLTAQSELMQHYSAAHEGQTSLAGSLAYRTVVHVLDGRRVPMPGARLQLWCDETAVVQIDGVAHAMRRGRGLSLQTGPQGTVELTIAAKSLGAPTLRLWSPTLSPDERMVIHMDDNVVTALQSLQGNDLLKPAASGKAAFDGKKSFLPDGFTAEQAEQAAQAARQAVATVCKPDGFEWGALVEDAGHWDRGHVVGRVVDHASYAPRSIGHTVADDWGYDFRTHRFERLFDVERAAHDVEVAALPSQPEQADVWWDRFVEGLSTATKIVFRAIDGVFTVFVHFAGSIEKLVAATVEHVGQAIFGFFQQLARAVGDIGTQVLSFFARLFNWDDIVRTQKAIEARGDTVLEGFTHLIDFLISKEQEVFGWAEQQLGGTFEKLIEKLNIKGFGVGIAEAVKGKTMDPFSPNPALSSSMGLLALEEKPRPVFGLQGRWFLEQFMAGLGAGLANVFPSTLDGPLAQAFTGFMAGMEATVTRLSSGPAAETLRKAWDDFSALLKTPERFFELSITGVLRIVEGALQLFVEVAMESVTAVLQVVRLAIETVRSVLKRKIEVPVVSWLYESLTAQPLTLMGVAALAVAVPATAIFKAFSGGRAPFAPDDGDAAPDVWGICSGVALALYGLFDNMNNAASPPVPIAIKVLFWPQMVTGWIAWVLEIAVFVCGVGPTVKQILDGFQPSVIPAVIGQLVSAWWFALIIVFDFMSLIYAQNRVDGVPGGPLLVAFGGVLSTFAAGLSFIFDFRNQTVASVASVLSAFVDISKGLRFPPINQNSYYIPWGISLACDRGNIIAGGWRIIASALASGESTEDLSEAIPA